MGQTVRNLEQDLDLHATDITQMRNSLSVIQKDVKLAIQQPPLPVPQLDDLKDRLEALASGLHSADLHGLHTKLETLQLAQADKARDETTSNVSQAIEKLRSGIDALKISQEEKLAELPQIVKALEALKELQVNDVPPPVPVKDTAGNETSPQEELLLSLKEQVVALNCHLDLLKEQAEKRDLTSQLEESVPLRSLSVFSKRSQSQAKEGSELQVTPASTEVGH